VTNQERPSDHLRIEIDRSVLRVSGSALRVSGGILSPGSDFAEVGIVGNASRNRRQKKDKERQRRRAKQAADLD
jgi:hypothetical protein